MNRTHRRAFGLPLAVVACSLALSAQSAVVEPRVGIEFKPPKGWTELPGGGDRHATVRLFAGPRALVGKEDVQHTPILRVMFFDKGGDASKDKIDDLPRMTAYRSLEDFALRGLGIKDATKAADKAGALEFQRVSGKNAARSVYGAAFAVDGAEAAVCFEVLTQHLDKLKKELDATITSVAVIARAPEPRIDPPWVTDADWSKKDLAARNATRKAWSEGAVARTTKNAGPTYKPSKSKHWSVLSAADPAFTKKAIAAAEVMRAWIAAKLPELAKEPMPAVLRVFDSKHHYNAYLTTVTETREYDQRLRELHFVNDPDNGGSGGYGMLFRAVMWHAFDDLDDQVLPALPRWLDNGIWEFLRSSQCDGKKVEFASSDTEKGRMAWYPQNNQEIPALWHLIEESLQKSPEDGKNEDPWAYTPDCARVIRWWLLNDGMKAFDKPNLFVDYVRALGKAHAETGPDPMLDVGSGILTDDENKKRNKGQYAWRDALLVKINTLVLAIGEPKWREANEKWGAFNKSFK